mgnify:CR=1 FL=1
MFKKIRDFVLKRKILSSVIAVILLGILIYIFIPKNNAQTYNYAPVKTMNISQIVSATGNVKAQQDLSLNFERTGKVKTVDVKVGDKVQKGQTLMALENSDLMAQLAQAQTNLAQARVQLENLKKGARPEQIQIYQTQLETAQNNLQQAQQQAVLSLNTVYTDTESAIENKVNQVFDPPSSYYPKLKFGTAYPDVEEKILNQKVNIEHLLEDWKKELPEITTDNLDEYLTKENEYLNTLRTFADDVYYLTTIATNYYSVTPQQVDLFKTDISLARTTLNNDLNLLNTTSNNLNSLKLAVKLAQDQLNLQKAGPTAEQIKTQELQIQGLQDGIDALNSQIAKTILTSPINGIITKINYETGETVQMTTPAISLISDKNFEIEVYIPEIDIANVKIGNPADIVLDAYGDGVVFKGQVIFIDPASTVLEGVPSYRTLLQFDNEDERIKSGMTANVDITTAYKENVLAIPIKAVINENNKKIVKVLKDKKSNIIEEREIKTGISDINGNIEVVEGLNPNELVILP